MLVAYPSDISWSPKTLIDRWCDSHGLETYESDRVTVRCSGRWTVSEDSKISFFDGTAYEWPAGNPTDATSSALQLSRSIGSFTSLVVDRGRLAITRSLYRSTSIFYTNVDGRPLISSNISILVAASGGFEWQKLDRDYCRDFIACRERFDGSTALQNVREVMLGERVVITENGQYSGEFINGPIPSETGIAETIRRTLHLFTRLHSKVALYFSGGFDSSALLWALRANQTDVIAVHVDSHTDCGESEYSDALLVANDMSCDVLRVMVEEPDYRLGFVADLATPVHTPYDVPLLAPATSPYFEALEFDISITGHGGDHVFVQNPESNAAFSHLRAGRLLTFLSVVQKLAQLKGMSSFDIVRDNIRLLLNLRSMSTIDPPWLPSSYHELDERHYLLRGLDRRTAKHKHLSTILAGLHTIPPSTGGRRSLAPLLLQNIIGLTAGMPVDTTFSKTHDRTSVREAIFASAGQAFAWRRTKRASSTFFYQLLSQSQGNIVRSVRDSKLAHELDINTALLIDDIKRNGCVSRTQTLKSILNFYRLDAYLRASEFQAREILRR